MCADSMCADSDTLLKLKYLTYFLVQGVVRVLRMDVNYHEPM
jgi:hypothetical protein